MGRRRRIKSLRFAPLILTIALGGGFVIHSVSGEIREYTNDSRVEQELEEINNSSTYEIPVFENEDVEVTSVPESASAESGEIESEEMVEEEEIPLRREISDELLTSGYEFKNINFDELMARNSEVNAWITIDGTNIDYPIMYAPDREDNTYYLHRDIDGNESNSGTLFLLNPSESLNNLEDDISDVSIIYGHHMRGGKMFAQICNYVNQSYYDKHPYGVIYTPDGYAYKLSFFAGIITPGTNNQEIYVVNNLVDSEEDREIFNNCVENARSKSTFESDLEVNFGDKIMILVTCEYTGGTNSRYALFGVMEKEYTNELQISNNDEQIRRLR